MRLFKKYEFSGFLLSKCFIFFFSLFPFILIFFVDNLSLKNLIFLLFLSSSDSIVNKNDDNIDLTLFSAPRNDGSFLLPKLFFGLNFSNFPIFLSFLDGFIILKSSSLS